MSTNQSSFTQTPTPLRSESSSVFSSNENEVCLSGYQDSLQVQQEFHEGPPSGELSDEAMIQKTQGGSAAVVHPCAEQHSATDASRGHVLFEEVNNTLKISSKGNVMVTAHTTDSSDQCKSINLSMGGIERIITEGKTTLEFVVQKDNNRQDKTSSENMNEDDEDETGLESESKDEDEKQHNTKDDNKDINENEAKADNHNGEEAAPKGTPRYDLRLLYVKELMDHRDDELLFRATSTEPFDKGKFQEQSLSQKTSHIIEVVVMTYVGRSVYWRGKRTGYKEDDMESSKVTKSGIRILSPLLQQVLNTVIGVDPEFNPADASSCIERPYLAIVQHIKELKDCKLMPAKEGLEEEFEERNKHVDCLLNFIESDLGKPWAAEQVRHQQSPPVATFEYCWMLFKLGTIVYRKANDIWSAWVVKSLSIQSSGGRVTLIEVLLWNLSFDGSNFVRCVDTHVIYPWEGERDPQSIGLYPADLQPESPAVGQPSMREKLIERGKKYAKLAYRSHCDYHGQCLVHPKRMYNSAVMIDTAMQPWRDSEFSSWEPISDPDPINQRVHYRGCTCHLCQQQQSRPLQNSALLASGDHISIDAKLTDEQYLICNYWVFGFVLNARRWEILSVDGLQEHQDNSDYIEKLVISAENLHMIKAICRTYARDYTDNSQHASWSADIIQGKGEGQIFLLHGKPGVGKTLTAECVAEYTRRPLLPLTSGDIGTDPVTVDRTLAKYFKLGESWGAIVLLDEADVYLEARNLHDLARNSLVSVFLRAMEYYQGILFLTTNRVGSFDEAFASRIHVQLYYGDLDADDRNKIYENLVAKLALDREDVKFEQGAMEYLQEDKAVQALGWNGRQIRNAFQTAVSLAEYDASEIAQSSQPCKHCKKLGHGIETCWVKYPQKKGHKVFIKRKHIEMVVRMSSRFKDYLKSAKGAEDSKLAMVHHLRADDFGKEVAAKT